MASGDGGDSKRRLRKARAALVILRRRVTRACDKLKSVDDFYSKLSALVAPVLAEFGDSFPPGARTHLETVRDAVEARSIEMWTTCKLCKGQLKEAIKDISHHLGLEGQIRDALEPLENLAPQWLLATPLAQMAAVAVTVVAGGGLAAAVATTVAGGGGGDGSASDRKPASTSVASAGTGDAVSSGSLPDPCELVTEADTEPVLGGPVDITPSEPGGNLRDCLYDPLGTADGDCRYVVVYVATDASLSNLETEPGLGDEAYWLLEDAAQLIVRQGDLWVTLDVWSSSECARDATPVAQSRDDARALMGIALDRL